MIALFRGGPRLLRADVPMMGPITFGTAVAIPVVARLSIDSLNPTLGIAPTLGAISLNALAHAINA